MAVAVKFCATCKNAPNAAYVKSATIARSKVRDLVKMSATLKRTIYEELHRSTDRSSLLHCICN